MLRMFPFKPSELDFFNLFSAYLTQNSTWSESVFQEMRVENLPRFQLDLGEFIPRRPVDQTGFRHAQRQFVNRLEEFVRRQGAAAVREHFQGGPHATRLAQAKTSGARFRPRFEASSAGCADWRLLQLSTPFSTN